MTTFSTRRAMRRTVPWPWEEDHDVLRSTLWFQGLFRSAHNRGLEVRFQVEPLGGGVFDTTPCEEDGDPFIVIHCAVEWGIVDDIPATIDLAHELGHHESWLRGECAGRVYAMMYDDLEREDEGLRRETLDEEERAWRYGKEILLQVHPTFSAFDTYERTAATALAEYGCGLLLE